MARIILWSILIGTDIIDAIAMGIITNFTLAKVARTDCLHVWLGSGGTSDWNVFKHVADVTVSPTHITVRKAYGPPQEFELADPASIDKVLSAIGESWATDCTDLCASMVKQS